MLLITSMLLYSCRGEGAVKAARAIEKAVEKGSKYGDDTYRLYNTATEDKNQSTGTIRKCAICNGEGHFDEQCEYCGGLGHDYYGYTCSNCNGYGSIRFNCTACGGKGQILVTNN